MTASVRWWAPPRPVSDLLMNGAPIPHLPQKGYTRFVGYDGGDKSSASATWARVSFLSFSMNSTAITTWAMILTAGLADTPN